MTGPFPTRARHVTRNALFAAGLAALTLSVAAAPAAAATTPTAPAVAAPAETASPPDTGVTGSTTVDEARPAENPAVRAAEVTEPGAADLAAAAIGPPAVTVSPTTGLNPAGGSSISVSGAGFDPAANNGFGVYAVFGPVDPGTYFKDANRFLAAVWLHPGGGSSGSPGQGELNANGTFSATLPALGGLPLTAQYTDGNGAPVDCMTTQCYIVTMAAHGVADRTKDTCTPVSFTGQTAVARVDSTCQPVAAPAGQPSPGATGSTPNGGTSGTGTTTGGAGGNGTTASSAQLPSTGSGSVPVAVLGVALLVSGLSLVRSDRRHRKSNGARAATQ